MKAIYLREKGRPEQACDCLEIDDIVSTAADEVVVKIEASAINPADLLIIEGRYPGPEELPAPMGIEGTGRVLAAGEAVEGLAVGDRVLSLGRSNWAQRVRLKASQALKIPNALEPRQGAMLKANPPTAHLMLRDYVDLEPGDLVIQNAANSAVGRHVIRLARARGLRTINVVRRAALIDELTALGADLVLVEDEDLGARVRAETGPDAPIRLAIDAVGGISCERLADCLSEFGVVVNYGFLSGEACRITPHQAIVGGVSLRGFWLLRALKDRPRPEVEALYAEMAAAFMEGILDVPVEASYGLEAIGPALAHANREGRSGKILLTPNGPLD